ncbi:hypothetical protein [uncultured Phenylobacterium sp.]|uniref:hypothetical protein n=1 Tax=uncultured Phenylobacterium sp. TaxID=349273 RepID=UPI0025F7627B|nr:hypothetical protein [uncultured Phenylobacterium sp.]
MKDLLDRYLAAVGRELPDRQRVDITAELRDELLTKIELREEAAGRPLERSEVEAVLLEFGHPLIIAGRYRKVQHLVGPEVFPVWWAGLKLSLCIVAAVYLVVAILHLTFAVGGPFADDQFPSLVTALLTTFGAVTLVAVVVERLNLQRFVYRWRPRQLPPAGVKPTSPFEREVEIGMEVVFILWWLEIIRFRNLFPLGDLVAELDRTVFDPWFWPVLAYSGYGLLTNVVGLMRPGAAQLNATLTLVRSVIVVGMSLGLLQAGHWVNVTSTLIPSHLLPTVQENFDLGVKVSLVVTAVSMAIKAVFDARRLWRARQDAQTPLSTRAA